VDELTRRGWTLERVAPEVYGTRDGGWRARKGGIVRGGYRLEHVVQQVDEHERWEAAQRPRRLVQLTLWAA
jgi:hypothetical protein